MIPTQILAYDNEKLVKQSHELELKSEFGCDPPDEWDLLKDSSRGSFIRDVCILNSYQAHEGPTTIDQTHLFLWFGKIFGKKILDIDERKKSLTLMVGMLSVWQDPRIKGKFVTLEKPVKLPSITTTRQDIWFPFKYPFIHNVKELTPLLDPIVAEEVILLSGKSTNKLLLEDRFPTNATSVMAYSKWRVKIFCDFLFSQYPFDEQDCAFKMTTWGLNITLYNESHEKDTKESGNFDVKQTAALFETTNNVIFQDIEQIVGISIKMKRQISAYIYRYYLPCAIIVVMSFFSFMIPLTALPGRIAIVVTQFLTLTSIFIHHIVSI